MGVIQSAINQGIGIAVAGIKLAKVEMQQRIKAQNARAEAISELKKEQIAYSKNWINELKNKQKV